MRNNDLAWTDDGDFVPEFDADGNVSDFMDTINYSIQRRRNRRVDDINRELERNPSVNPDVVKNAIPWYNETVEDHYGSLFEIIRDRLKTNNPDWFPYLRVGADLEDFIGATTIDTVKNILQLQIMKTLVYDGLVDPGALNVYIFEDGPESVIISIKVNTSYGDISLTIPFSFTEGVRDIL